MESSTKILRRLLDERGVEYRFNESTKVFEWHFEGTDGEGSAHATEVNGGINIIACSLTPEQAIAATLGRGTCRNVAVPDEYSDRPFTCSECGARGPMGNGTYHLASSWAMEDGTLAFGDSWPVWKYCPNCGRKVVDE